jgi:hypothetical protein
MIKECHPCPKHSNMFSSAWILERPTPLVYPFISNPKKNASHNKPKPIWPQKESFFSQQTKTYLAPKRVLLTTNQNLFE